MADLIVNGASSKLATEKYVDDRLAGQGGGDGAAAWGSITGDIENQTDLMTEFSKIKEISQDTLRDILDTAGFPTAFLQQGE